MGLPGALLLAMDSIRASKENVLARVKANRDQHRGIFEEAIVGYRARMREELDARIADLEAGRAIDHLIGLVAPQDHTVDYDRVIAMLEMDIQTTVDLGERDFACYVMDDWQWRRDFLKNAVDYGSARGAMATTGKLP